jgi:hypothetical protein
MTDENIEKLGETIDRLDNVTHALNLMMSPQFHVTQLKSLLPEIVAELKKNFALVTGQNPWA